jgi:hypothetical protein
MVNNYCEILPNCSIFLMSKQKGRVLPRPLSERRISDHHVAAKGERRIAKTPKRAGEIGDSSSGL